MATDGLADVNATARLLSDTPVAETTHAANWRTLSMGSTSAVGDTATLAGPARTATFVR